MAHRTILLSHLMISSVQIVWRKKSLNAESHGICQLKKQPAVISELKVS